MGMSLTSTDLFNRIARTGLRYDTENVPPTPYGGEVAYLRTVSNDIFRYGQAIKAASDVGRNQGLYPQSNLARHLSIVARLIKGNLGARVYHVGINGFDTHADQGRVTGMHATLLRQLAEAVAAFAYDLKTGGWDEQVLMMTFSEFGRRVEQNGSFGTDHGTAAPLFLFGPGLNGGLFGDAPSLSDLDEDGNLKHSIDFRAVYATVLQHWFGFDALTSEAVLGHHYDPLAFIAEPAEVTVATEEAAEVPEASTLNQNYPNPFNPTTTISYKLARVTSVRLRVYDVQGRLVSTLVEARQPAGTHTVSFDAGRLPSGSYFYRLELPEGTKTRQMMLVR